MFGFRLVHPRHVSLLPTHSCCSDGPTRFSKALGTKKTRDGGPAGNGSNLKWAEIVPVTRETIRGPAVIQPVSPCLPRVLNAISATTSMSPITGSPSLLGILVLKPMGSCNFIHANGKSATTAVHRNQPVSLSLSQRFLQFNQRLQVRVLPQGIEDSRLNPWERSSAVSSVPK